ncbi:MAG: serine protease, partial [Myxococcaceae bacterium]
MSDDEQARHARTDEALRRARASLVLLELGAHTATGFVLTSEGHVVTSLHAVASARAITAVLPDGLRTQVVQVAAVDERRDLVLLRLSVPDLAPALALGPATLPTEGEGLRGAAGAGVQHVEALSLGGQRGGAQRERGGEVRHGQPQQDQVAPLVH